MRQGIYTSGFFHLFGGFLLIANFQLLEDNSNEVLDKVTVKLLSEQELIDLVEGEKTSDKEAEIFQPRKKLSKNAKRAGWQGYYYDLSKDSDRLVRLL